MKNLWPEPEDPRPGDAEKDQLENDLHARVCKGEISLADSQKCIASNSVGCRKKYLRSGIISEVPVSSGIHVLLKLASPVLLFASS
jgi:hypothetical protein